MAKKTKTKPPFKLRIRWNEIFKTGLALAMNYLCLVLGAIQALKQATLGRFSTPSCNNFYADDEGNVTQKPTALTKLFRFFWSRKRKPTRNLLQWVQEHLGNMGIHVTNFDTNWSDGLALCALVEALCPGACPKYDLLTPSNKLNNCRFALKLAHKYLGISNQNIISAEEMTKERDGEKMRQFLKIIRLTVSTNHKAPSMTSVDCPQTPTFSCHAKGRGLEAGLVGKISKFNITFSAESNPYITVHITGPNGAHHHEVITGIEHRFDGGHYLKSNAPENEESKGQTDNTKTIQFEHHRIDGNRIEVNYIPNTPGIYSIEIKRRGNHISRSPFYVIVAETLEKLNAKTKGKCCRRIVESNNYRRPVLERIPSSSQMNIQDIPILQISQGDARNVDHAAAVLKRTSTVHRSYSKTNTDLGLQKQVTIKRRRVLKTVMTKDGQEIIIHEGLSTTSNSSQDSDEVKGAELSESKIRLDKEIKGGNIDAVGELASKLVGAAMTEALRALKHEYRVEALENKRRRLLSKCGSLAADAFRQRVPIGEGRRVKSSNALLPPEFTRHYNISPFSASIDKPKTDDAAANNDSAGIEMSSVLKSRQKSENDPQQSAETLHQESDPTAHSSSLGATYKSLKISTESEKLSTTSESACTNESLDEVDRCADLYAHRPLGKTRSYPTTKPASVMARQEMKSTNQRDYNMGLPRTPRTIGRGQNRLQQSLSLPAFIHKWKAIDFDSDDEDDDSDLAEIHTQYTEHSQGSSDFPTVQSHTESILNSSQETQNPDAERQSPGFVTLHSPHNAHVTGSRSESTVSSRSVLSSPVPRALSPLSLNQEALVQEETGFLINKNSGNQCAINDFSTGCVASAFMSLSPLGLNTARRRNLQNCKCDKSTQVKYEEIKSETGWVSLTRTALPHRIPIHEGKEGVSSGYESGGGQANTQPGNEPCQGSISSLSTSDSAISIPDKKIRRLRGNASSSCNKPIFSRTGKGQRKPHKNKLQLDSKLTSSNPGKCLEHSRMLRKFLRVWQSNRRSPNTCSEIVHSAKQKFRKTSCRTKIISKRVKFANKILVHYRSSSRKSISMRSSQGLKESRSDSPQDVDKFPPKLDHSASDVQSEASSIKGSRSEREAQRPNKQTTTVDGSFSANDIVSPKRQPALLNTSSVCVELGDSTPSLTSDDASITDDTDFKVDDSYDPYQIDSFGISGEPRDNLLSELSSFRRLSLPLLKRPPISSLNNSWHFKTIADSTGSSFRQELSQVSLSSDLGEQMEASVTPSWLSHDRLTNSQDDFKTNNPATSKEDEHLFDFLDMYKPLKENAVTVNNTTESPQMHNISDTYLTPLDQLDGEESTLGGLDTSSSNENKPNASKCYAFGAGLHFGQVNFKNNFQVRTKAAGNGCLGVTITGPSPHTVTETNIMYTGDDLYEVFYDVTEPGLYIICIKWSDESIMDSPYICKVAF